MPKSEYYEPKKLPGERPYPQIKEDADEIYGLLLQADTMMTKVDKIRYNNRAIGQILDVIKEFTLAYDFEEDREIHLKRMCANVAVFLLTMRKIGERNVIRVKNPLDTSSPDSIKLQLIEHIGKLDEGATRWKNSIINSRNKGTSGIAKQ
ncbi:MAG: hypothetical protein LKJ87_09475 [Bacteroidales bacterium]|jgi:hypothetical protein|nr:hypothetical protein [Bacteroidales bacterium]